MVSEVRLAACVLLSETRTASTERAAVSQGTVTEAVRSRTARRSCAPNGESSGGAAAADGSGGGLDASPASPSAEPVAVSHADASAGGTTRAPTPVSRMVKTCSSCCSGSTGSLPSGVAAASAREATWLIERSLGSGSSDSSDSSTSSPTWTSSISRGGSAPAATRGGGSIHAMVGEESTMPTWTGRLRQTSTPYERIAPTNERTMEEETRSSSMAAAHCEGGSWRKLRSDERKRGLRRRRIGCISAESCSAASESSGSVSAAMAKAALPPARSLLSSWRSCGHGVERSVSASEATETCSPSPLTARCLTEAWIPPISKETSPAPSAEYSVALMIGRLTAPTSSSEVGSAPPPSLACDAAASLAASASASPSIRVSSRRCTSASGQSPTAHRALTASSSSDSGTSDVSVTAFSSSLKRPHQSNPLGERGRATERCLRSLGTCPSSFHHLPLIRWLSSLASSR